MNAGYVKSWMLGFPSSAFDRKRKYRVELSGNNRLISDIECHLDIFDIKGTYLWVHALDKTLTPGKKLDFMVILTTSDTDCTFLSIGFRAKIENLFFQGARISDCPKGLLCRGLKI